MALVLADRIKETTTTTGTGTYTLAGAVAGFEPFTTIGNGNTTYYACTLGSDFEVGIGTYTASGTTLARTTILQSTNNDNAVNWGAGEKTIFCTQPAEKAVFLNASDNIELADNEKIILGTGGDLEIFHDGSNSIIKDVGTGSIVMRTNGSFIQLDTTSTVMAKFIKDGAVELRHNNSKKLETTSSGATVTGTAKATVKFETDDVTVGFTSNGATSGSGNFGVASSNGGARINADSGSNAATFVDFDATNISASGGDVTYRFGRGTTEGSSDLSQLIFYAHDGTNNPVITLDSTGKIHGDSLDIARDTDASAEIGRAHIGNVNHGDFAGFSHVDQNFSGNYALLQGSTGTTFLNAASGQTINYRINNSTVMQMDSSGLDITGDLTLTSTDGGTSEDPSLDLYRNSSSPADNDILGNIDFSGENSADEKVVYSTIRGRVRDVTDGTEDGELQFRLMQGGSESLRLQLNGNFDTFFYNQNVHLFTGVDLSFEGATNNDFETTLTVTDPTADRTITLPDETGTVSLLTNTETLTNKTLTTPVINGFSGTGNATITGVLKAFADNTSLGGLIEIEQDGTGDAAIDFILSGTREYSVGIDNSDGDKFKIATSAGLATGAALEIDTSGNTNLNGDLTLTSTDAGATENPTLDLYRNSSSPADGDLLGEILFSGENDADEKIQYAQIKGTILDNTDGTEDGELRLSALTGGSNQLYQRMTASANILYQDILLKNAKNIQFEGATDDAHETTLTATDPTADRTITLPDATGTVLLNTGDQTITGDLTLTSTDAGDTAQPTLSLYRNSASPAFVDNLGQIQFFGENNADEKVEYARIDAVVITVTDGSEAGQLDFSVAESGSNPTYFRMVAGKNQFFKSIYLGATYNLVFEGSAYNDHETTLTVTNPTADRTITLPDATGTVLLADGDGSNLTNVNATTLDSVDSTSFLRSDAADIKTSGNLRFNDSVKATFGTTDDDLQIFHSGTNSFIQDLGTGNLYITSNGTQILLRNTADDEDLAKFINGGAVELYHDNSKKFETTSTGASITGGLTANVTGDGTEVLRLGTERPWSFLQRSTGASSSLAFRSTVDAKNFDIENEDGGLIARFIANNSTGLAALYHGGSQKFITTSSGAQIDGDLELKSTDAGATENPTLDLYRNSSSPADSDILGHINFSGENSAGEKIVYAEVESAINDQTDGTEDGEFIIRSMLNGTLTKYYSAGFGSNIMLKPISFTAGASTIFFEGTTNNTFETSFTVTDPTADRTITLPDATGTVLTTGNSDTPTTTTSSSDADFILVDDGGTMKKITPANLGISANQDYGLITSSTASSQDYGAIT